DLDQLTFAAGGVFGGEHLDHKGPFAHRGAHGGDGFRLVVLDADQHLFGLQQMGKDFDAGDQLDGFFAHQQIVSSDVRLALGTVDDQRADLLAGPHTEFYRTGKTGSAQTVDTGVTNDLQQRSG